MTDTILSWEPDVEGYKLEHFTNLGVLPAGAFSVRYRRDQLENRGTDVGSLYGELRGIKQLKLDALKSLVWKVVQEGRNPLDVTFHVNRMFFDGVEHLVFWVV